LPDCIWEPAMPLEEEIKKTGPLDTWSSGMSAQTASSKSAVTAHATGNEKLKAHIAMIFFASFIAVSFSLGKLSVPHIAPEPINAIRFALAALIMGIFAFAIKRQPLRMPVAPWRYAILSGLMSFYFLTMFVALSLTTPVSTSAVYTLTPIVTVVFGYLILKQILRPVMAISLLFAFIGSVWVIFRGDIEAIVAFNIGKGEMIYFLGCVAHAMFTVLLPKFNRGEPLPVSTFFILLGNAVWISLYGFSSILATDWLHLPAIVWVAIAYLVVFPSAITFVLVQYAAQRLPASKVMAYGYLVPVFVIAFEGAIGHGWVSIGVAAGALVTCLGLVVLYFAPDR